MNEDESIIELLNEDNQPERFEHLMTLSYKENPYLVMHPVESKDEGEVVIFAVENEGEDGESYRIVDDEKLAQEVFDEFLLILDSDEDDEEE